MDEFNCNTNRTSNAFNSLIAIGANKTAILINSEPNLITENIFDGDYLDDNLTDIRNIPTEPGLYKCKIFVYGYKCVNDCGTEYYMDVWMDSIEKIDQ